MNYNLPRLGVRWNKSQFLMILNYNSPYLDEIDQTLITDNI